MRLLSPAQEWSLLQLPVHPREVWWADRRSVNVVVEGEGRMAATLWVDAETGVLRSFALSSARDDGSAAWVSSLLSAFERPLAGHAPGRPAGVALADPLGAALLREPLERLGVEVELLERSALDPAFHGFERVASSGGYRYTAGDGVEPELVNELFHAAGRLWECSSWNSLGPVDLLELRGVADAPLYCTVSELGLSLFTSLERVNAAANEQQRACLTLRLATPREAGSELLDEAERHDWPILEDEGGELFLPLVLSPERRPPGAGQLRMLVDVMAALEVWGEHRADQVNLGDGRPVEVSRYALLSTPA